MPLRNTPHFTSWWDATQRPYLQHTPKLWYESKKIAPKREGPFIVTEVLGPLTYRLNIPAQWKIHPIFHASLLTPYKENNIHGPNYVKPPPDIVEGQSEYKVEAIISHRRQGRGHQYLIKWKGYSTAENTWEPERNLNNAKDILQDYKTRHSLPL